MCTLITSISTFLSCMWIKIEEGLLGFLLSLPQHDGVTNGSSFIKSFDFLVEGHVWVGEKAQSIEEQYNTGVKECKNILLRCAILSVKPLFG